MASPTPPLAPVAPPPVEPHRSTASRGWTIALGIVLAVVLVVAIAGTLIRVPYVIFSPGSATPTGPKVRISGARTYLHKGKVLFLTVSVSTGEPNVWRFVQASLDDSSDVVGEDDVLQGQSRGAVQRASVKDMDDSQLFAKKVALEQLGYRVPVTGAGAKVQAVIPKSPADGKLHSKDVITAIDGTRVRLSDEVGEIVRAKPPGTKFEFTVSRLGQTRAVEITTAAAPSGDLRGKPYIGILAATEDLKVVFPVDVTINPGPVSGPSAGLAFTLTIIDKMSPGNVTGSKDIAVTGTIDPEGRVGEVGGVRQKTASAAAAGARLFLVPVAEVKEARKGAGDEMKVVGVRTIEDALRVLRRNGGAPVQKVAPAA